MGVPAELARDPAVAGPLGSLALSVVQPHTPTLALRALRWHRDLDRLGVRMPLAVVHDLGLLLACANEQLQIGARLNVEPLLAGTRGAEATLAAYHALIQEVAGSEAAKKSRSLSLSDDIIVVLLARLLGSVTERIAVSPTYVNGVPLDAALLEHIEGELPALYQSVNRVHDLAAIGELVAARLYVLTLVDALDLDTLQLFGMLGGDAGQGALAQVDLLAALGAPEANDIVDFSLEILPSVLEAKAKPGASSFSAFGYAGLARKGSIDSLVLTELAWDAEELVRRMADDEVLYYSRELAKDEARRVHHFVIDASASMRGERTTFARGMALAAAKKLLLSGEDVTFRFFDSRLYEAHAARNGQIPVAYLLSFRGERGRNSARVFADLARTLELSALRDPRDPVLHLFTHAGLYIPRETMTEVTRRAKVAAVFMMPSGGALHLEYLDLLDAHWVVDHQVLTSRGERAEEARRILDDVDVPRRDAEGSPKSRRDPPASRRTEQRT